MKKLISNYVFDASAKTVTLTDYSPVVLAALLLITNVTDNIVIYNFADPTLGGSAAIDVVTLDYDTTSMSDSDELQIWYFDTVVDTQPISGTVTANVGTGTQPVSGTVSVSNLPGTQPVSGTVTANAGTGPFPVSDNGGSLTVDGTVGVNNFPATQPVSGTVTADAGTGPWPVTDNGGSLTIDGSVSVSNFPATQPVSIAATLPVSDGGGSLTVDGSVGVSSLPAIPAGAAHIGEVSVSNLPATQAVSGTVSVNALPAGNNNIGDVDVVTMPVVQVGDNGGSLTVDGSVSVSNFPGTQPVSGTVTANAGTGVFHVDDNSGSLTVDGTVAVSNFPATQPVSGTITANAGTGVFHVDDNSGSLTVDGSVSVSNFPATQPVSGTITANVGTGTQPVSGTVAVSNLSSTASSIDNITVSAVNDVNSRSYLYNASSWDRYRGNEQVTMLASGARTTTQGGTTLTNFNGITALVIVLDVTSAGTGSITFSIDGFDLASSKYQNILTGSPVITNSTNVYRVGPNILAVANSIAQDYLPRYFRILVTANNANSVTYSLGYTMLR